MKVSTYTVVAAMAFTAAAASSHTAMAQTAAAPAAAPVTTAAAAATADHADQAATLSTVEVRATRDTDSDGLQLSRQAGTASRLGLSLRETPASVEVLTQDTIAQRGGRTLTEVLRGAVGVSGGNPPSAPTTLSMRGFTSALYLYDGIRSSGAGVTNRVEDTWNYDRIEILKGPASVLNGDAAIGGIVNFIAKRPDRAASGSEAFVSYGSYGSVRAGVGTGGALGEASAYRVDYSHNDSRAGNVARNGEKMDHLTTALAVELGAGARLDLSFDYMKDDNQAYFGTPLVPAAFATRPSGVVSTPDGRVIDRSIAANNYNVLDNVNMSDTYWLRAKLSGHLGSAWTWRNELAANQAERIFKNAESAVFAAPDRIRRDQTLITHDQHYLFDRFDLSHNGQLGGFDNRVVIGAELSKTAFDSQRRFSDSAASTAAALTVAAWRPQVGYFNEAPGLSTGAGNRTDTTSDVKTRSLFMEDALKLSPRVTLVAGLRYDHTDVQRTIRDLNTSTYSAFGADYSAVSTRVGGVFNVNQESTLYAQFTNATIPVNTLFLYSLANTAFAPSRGKQAEVGFKQSLAGNQIEWTAALYRIELNNVLSRDAVNPALTVNNGSQSSKGIELAAAWRASRQLTLSGNVAVLDAGYDTLVEASAGSSVSRVGNVPTNVPERVANLFATYRLDGVPAELYVGVNHTGAMFTDTANQIRINGHTTADAAVSYRLKPALLTLRVRNLSDKLYATYGGRAASQVLLAPLRTVELSAKFDF